MLTKKNLFGASSNHVGVTTVTDLNGSEGFHLLHLSLCVEGEGDAGTLVRGQRGLDLKRRRWLQAKAGRQKSHGNTTH